MFYQNLRFPKVKNRPFFYTNFVQTVDGKTQVKRKGYWPIGSKKDYQVLLELRAYADCLIHGGNLAKEFGEVTFERLQNPFFKTLRKKLGKSTDLPYIVVTNHSENLRSHPWGANVTFFTGNLKKLLIDLKRKGHQSVLVEGGPTLLASFLKEGLIDEVFLTIVPKIYGTKSGQTLTLVEGYLFPKNSTKKLKLISVRTINSELFLRYKLT